MRLPTMSGSFLLRIFQVIQNDRSLKNVAEFKIPSLPNPVNAHSHACTTSIIYCMHIKYLLRVTFCVGQRNHRCLLSCWSMNYRLYSSTYQKIIKWKIPSLPINKTCSYIYYECFTSFILVLLIIVYLWNNQFLYVPSKLHVIINEI